MSFRRMSGYGATVMLSCAAGWFMSAPEGAPASSSAASPTLCERPGASHADGVAALTDPPPLIAVTSDGIATLRVEQQPLEWVLEEIAKQSGWSDIKERAGAAARKLQHGAEPGHRLLESGRIDAVTAEQADP